MIHLTLIGGGYVGLVSATCFASFGLQVTLIEHDEKRLTSLQNTLIPFYEPGLQDLFLEQKEAGRLLISNDLTLALSQSQAVFIAVGTPTDPKTHYTDLSAVYGAAREIAKNAQNDLILITKSTVPVGTGRDILKICQKECPEKRFHILSNPEFLREGNAIFDFLNPDRVIIGLDQNHPEDHPFLKEFIEKIYAPIAPEKRLFMGLESAELTKYAANSFLAMKVAFINEISDLCEKTNGNIVEIARGIGLDPRINPHCLSPGPGFGGSCFPKDTQALVSTAQRLKLSIPLIEASITANHAHKEKLIERILHHLQQDQKTHKDHVNPTKIAVLGLAFKAGTDDMREAPALTILPPLHQAGFSLHLYDPYAMENARPLLPSSLHYGPDLERTLKDADALLLLTEWDIFKSLTPEKLKTLMKGRIIFDFRNLWERESFLKSGFDYHNLGLGA